MNKLNEADKTQHEICCVHPVWFEMKGKVTRRIFAFFPKLSDLGCSKTEWYGLFFIKLRKTYNCSLFGCMHVSWLHGYHTMCDSQCT